MVVVVMILVAWVVILGPSMIRRRARAGSQQSIVHFHHQLRILEHSAPEPIVAPAYRLRAVDGTDAPHGISYPGTGQRPVLTVVGAKDLPRPALALLGEPAPGFPAGEGFVKAIRGFGLVFFPVLAGVCVSVGWFFAGSQIRNTARRLRRRSS
mgnify:CR=1 FL=1